MAKATRLVAWSKDDVKNLRVFAKAKVGTLDELVERLGLSVSAPLAGGRAGRRLSQVTSIASHFVALGAVYAEH